MNPVVYLTHNLPIEYPLTITLDSSPYYTPKRSDQIKKKRRNKSK